MGYVGQRGTVVAPVPWASPVAGRRARVALAVAVCVGAAIIAAALLSGRGSALAAALATATRADWRLVLAAVAFEVLSFASYVALFHAVFRRSTVKVGLRASYEITVAGTAASRLAPTAGAGGVVLTAWALRRAGLSRRRVGEDLFAFLVLLYSVYLLGLLLAATLTVTGVAGTRGGPVLALVAGAVAALAIAAALVAGPVGRRLGDRGRLAGGARAIACGMSRARDLLRTRDPALAGAVGWWAFDIAVLWSTFQALGAAPPLAALTLGYFLGTMANTLPVPGAVSGGMIGVQVALGASLGIAVVAVLAYRAVALWLPAVAGAHALPRLRRTVAGWQT